MTDPRTGKRLLREFIPLQYTPQSLLESTGEDGRVYIRGIIQRANAKNQNNRVYPRDLLVREVEAYQKLVRENRAVGELDHPQESVVSLTNASHVIREISWQGDDVYGVVEVLDTPRGQILKTLLRSGIAIGISSRGVGSTQKNESGCEVVQPDFDLVAFDMVSEPSTQGAYLHEGVSHDQREVPRDDRVNRLVVDFLMRRGRL